MKVVIVGAGFGGLRLARKLNNKPGFEIVLVDKYNYHQFQPLFYQVATAALDASNISFPLRKAFQGTKNVHVRIEELRGVNTAEKKILTNSEDIFYDILVLATGADTNFFGNQKVETKVYLMLPTDAEEVEVDGCGVFEGRVITEPRPATESWIDLQVEQSDKSNEF